jgi:hypothetical protein
MVPGRHRLGSCLCSPLLGDPSHEVRRFAADTVRDAGSAAALVADDLVALLAHADRAPDAEQSALDALIWIDDPRWPQSLHATWQCDRTDLERLAAALTAAEPQFDAELLTGCLRLSAAAPA